MEKKFIIKNELGLHARPISKWLAIFKDTGVTVTVTKGEKTVNGKSMIGLMQVSAKKDDEILVDIEGDASLELMDALSVLIEDGFGE